MLEACVTVTNAHATLNVYIALIDISAANTYTLVMDKLREILPYLPIIATFSEMESVTGTAEILGVPQPQVSRTLARVEEIMAIPLRQREGRTVTPTREAHTLGKAAREALVQLSNTLNTLDGDGEIRGSVRLAFQHSLGESVVPQAISAFVATHKAVTFGLFQGARDECLQAVESGRADVAFIAVVPDSMGFKTTIIQREKLALAVPTDHELASKQNVQPQDFAQQEIIALKHGLGLRKSTDALLRQWGIAPTVTFEGQEISTVLGLVSAGLGVAIVPARAARPGITIVPIDDKASQRDLVLVTDPSRANSTATKSFVQSTQNLFC